MVRVRVICVVRGASFSPALAEQTTGLALDRKVEPGEASRLAPRGSGGGRAEVVVQEYGELADLAGKHAGGLMALGRSTEALRRAGATELVLKVDIEYAGACQFELPADLVRRLADLGIPLAIACFPKDETEELGSGSDAF
jgi:hypothetical protein